MRKAWGLPTCVWIGLLGTCLAEGEDRPNVLLICVDDLRPVLGCYGGAAHTPHLDRFAQSAVQFNRHYVQFPSCGPSRACMLGGVRPDTLQLYGNGGAGRVAEAPDTRPTMPLFFRNHGYTTLSFGKTYHSKGAGPGFGWSQPPWHPESGWTCYVNFKPSGRNAKGQWRPAYEIYDGPDLLHSDCQTADRAIEAISMHHDNPFFIAVGFYKPHLPFVAPKRFWDLYEDDEIKPLGSWDIPEDAARYQYEWSEIWAYGDQDGKLYSQERPPTPNEARDMIRAYYAAVSFNDAQIGRLLAALDDRGFRENTAVVVWSDHGFHLGDQARWAKWTQFESDMRSPLMIRLPGSEGAGRTTDALVESVDLYPTLSEACGLDPPEHLEGTSLLPLLQGTAPRVKQMAISQVRPLGKNFSHLLAYSVRTADYRYIQWLDTNRGFQPVNAELYDLRTATAETRNVVHDPAYHDVVQAMEREVPRPPVVKTKTVPSPKSARSVRESPPRT